MFSSYSSSEGLLQNCMTFMVVFTQNSSILNWAVSQPIAFMTIIELGIYHHHTWLWERKEKSLHGIYCWCMHVINYTIHNYVWWCDNPWSISGYFLHCVPSVVDSVCSGTYICANLICVAFIGMTPVPSAASVSLPESPIPSPSTSPIHSLSTSPTSMSPIASANLWPVLFAPLAVVLLVLFIVAVAALLYCKQRRRNKHGLSKGLLEDHSDIPFHTYMETTNTADSNSEPQLCSLLTIAIIDGSGLLSSVPWLFRCLGLKRSSFLAAVSGSLWQCVLCNCNYGILRTWNSTPNKWFLPPQQ